MTKQGKRPKGTEIMTPFGRAGFSALLRPSTKFNADGEFNAKVILDDGPQTAEFIASLQKLYEAAYQTNLAEARAEKPKLASIKRADPPFKRVVDADTGEELPQWSVNARMKAVRRGPGVLQDEVDEQTGETRQVKKPGPILGYNKPILRDSRNQPVFTEIGNGSVIRFQAYAVPFFTAALGSGLQLKLMGVQVRELVPYAQARVDFDEVDGGFVETAQAPPPQTPAHNKPVERLSEPAIDTTSEDSAEWV